MEWEFYQTEVGQNNSLPHWNFGLTSFNIYPLNIFFGLVGSWFWLIAGMRAKDGTQ